MNDEERAMWINNDEGLYNWFKSERKPMRQFIKENRADITKHIEIATGNIDTEKLLAREYYPASRTY